MPITGRFVADFADFQSAVQKATVSLVGMETGAGKVSTSLNKMVDQFSGRKIIQDAELMSQAFEQLAAKGIGLTNAELLRMGKVADEAIAKLKAGGEAVPPGMQKIADAAAKIKPPIDQAQVSAQTFFSALKSAAGLVGVVFSTQALVGFVGKVFDAASNIKDMSDRLSISTDAVQGFKFAAEQAGSSMDEVGTAINFMARALAGGDNSVTQALTDAKLEFSAVRGMRMEDAFTTIGEAVAKIEDPMKRAEAATALLGRGSAQLVAAMGQDFKQVADDANKMSEDTIRSLEAAQDAWASLANTVVIATGTIIAKSMAAVSEVTSGWDRAAVFLSNLTKFGPGVAASLAMVTAEARTMTTTLSEAQKKEIAELVRLGGTAEGIGKLFGEAGSAAQRFADSLVQVGDSSARARSEVIAAASAAKAHWDEVERASAARSKASREAAAADKAWAAELSRVNLQMGILAAQRDPLLPLTQSVETAITQIRTFRGYLEMPVSKTALVDFWDTVHAKGKTATDTAKLFHEQLGNLSQALSQLAQVAGGTFSKLASGLATLVSSADVAIKSIENIKKGASAGFNMTGILSMASGIAGLVSAAAAAYQGLKKLFNLGGPSEEQLAGRALIADFHAELESMLTAAQRAEAGNEAWKIDVIAIRDAYLAAGRTIEEAEAATKALWESAEGGSETARRQIEKIRDIIDRNTDATELNTSATEEQAQATIETATQAAKALDELTPKLKANEADWRSWGDVVTAQIQKIADGLRGLKLPSPAPSSLMVSAGGASTPSLTAGTGGAGITLNTRITSVIDGEVVGETMARQVFQGA